MEQTDTSLLQHANDELLKEEKFDYILVFTNTFELKDDEFVEEQRVEKIFHDIFKLHVLPAKMLDAETAKLQNNLEAALKKFIEANIVEGKISLNALGKEVMEQAFMVLQDYLKLELNVFFSRDRDEIYVRLRTSDNNLQVQAHLIEYTLQFRANPEFPEDFADAPPYANFLKPSKKSGLGMLSGNKPDINNIFKTYDQDDVEINTDTGSFFQYKDRVRLIYSMLSSTLDMSSLTNLNLLLQHYPVHRNKQLENLKTNWASLGRLLKRQDLEKISEYFGEKVGFYFALLEFYIIWLTVPALLGLISYIIYMTTSGSTNDDSSSMTIGELSIFVFSMFMCFYSTLFDQMWIREEFVYSWKWGMWKQHLEEPQRQEFQGEIGIDDLTGRVKKLKDSAEQNFVKRMFSYAAVAMFVCLVIAVIVGIFLYRATVKNTSWGPAVCAIINAVQIKVFNLLYSIVARKLNNWENYETNSAYFDALSIKLYLFQFVNSYASLFYIAFAKGTVEGCENNDCMSELSTQLTFIFLTNIALNALELGLPYLHSKFLDYMELRKLADLQARGEYVRLFMYSAEAQAKMINYDTPLEDFMEVVIQYGYVVMFCSSFAISPILALIITVLEVRIDAWKLCYLTQRPYPEIASSIGVWYDILVTISYFGAITNAAIVVFTADVFDLSDDRDRWFAFLMIEHALLVSKFLLSIAIPDKPSLVTNAILWNDRITKEKLYSRFSNKSKEREAWNLYYKPHEGYEAIRFDRRAIEARAE
jgi:hypothetical protein